MKNFKLEKDQKEEIISQIQKYFLDERDEEMGNLLALLLMDFMIKQIGPAIYNQAIKDAHALVSKKIEDLYGLEK